jgi:hypothetical protein
MSLRSDTLSWFRANQSLLVLLDAASLAKKQQIQIFKVFRLTRPGLEPTIYSIRGEHANHYATVYLFIDVGVTQICSVCRSHNPILLSSFITLLPNITYDYILWFLRSLTQRVPHVEQALLTHSEHISKGLAFSGGCICQFLTFCIVFWC